MKKKMCLLMLMLIGCFVQAQTNLVPNPDFENYNQCPSTSVNITDCTHWMNFGNSPEYFNACGPNGTSVPYAGFGFQYAHSGVGMAGLVTWVNSLNEPQNINYREFIAAQLTTTLTIGQKYYMSFYINYSGYPNNGIKTQIASNKVGLNFSTISSNSVSLMPLNNIAPLYANMICTDTLNWIKISGSFIADSSYKYVVIGNFFDDAHTDTLSLSNEQLVGYASYYFIDDVCVSTDSLYTNTWTGVRDNVKPANLSVFPNPTTDYIIIKAGINLISIKIYDIYGKLVLEELSKNYEVVIDTKVLEKGMYYIKVNDQEIYSKKLIIQ